jgi:hypothetical protein
MPFSWRKWILSICRVQESPLTNYHVHYLNIQPSSISFTLPNSSSSITYSTKEVSDLLLNLLPASLSLSILSYFVRAESTDYPDQFWDIREQRFFKEIEAAWKYSSSESYNQVKDYKWLNIDGPCRSGNTTHDMFNRGLKRLRTKFSRHHSVLLFPYANDSKNVGYRTQHMYNISLGLDDLWIFTWTCSCGRSFL